MLADESIFHLIQTFKVHDTLDYLSDHCPFSSVLNLNCFKENSKNVIVNQLCAPKKISWDGLIENRFRMKLACKKTDELIHDINLLSLDSNEAIENALLQINNILTDAVDVRVNRKISRKVNRKKSKTINKPWFKDELVILKKCLKKAGQDLVNNCRDDFF